MLRASARGSPRRKRRPESSPSRRAIEVRVLDLVEQRLVADPQDLRRFTAVPAGVLERSGNQVPLGLARSPPRDFLEGPQLGRRRIAPRRGRPLGDGLLRGFRWLL